MAKSKNNAYPGATGYRDRHGKMRWRYRFKGRSVELTGQYGSSDFKQAYDAAVGGNKLVKIQAKYGTIDWLVIQYLSSVRFLDLAPTRKKAVRGVLDWVRQEAGDLPLDKCEPRHVEALMMKKEGPTAANSIRKELSVIYNFAIKTLGLKHVTNPVPRSSLRKEPKGGYHTWTEPEIERFLAVHPAGTQQRLAALLALNTGASRVDLAGMGWQNVTPGGRIIYSRHKTGVHASIPIHKDLAEELLHIPRERLLFLQTMEGKPRTVPGLGNWFRAAVEKAKLEKCSLHGLRKSGATRLANAGATADELKAFLAHSTTREGSVYTDAADRARLADNAMARLKS